MERTRDAARTRQVLLETAGDLFARQGYAATTVREIADGAGVNVALINRYFSSKEGLFQACLGHVSDDLERSDTLGGDAPLSELIARRLVELTSDCRRLRVLPLLLRSSGDPRAEEIRLATLRTFGEQIAAAAGWTSDQGDELLVRAQLVLAASLGITLLRSPTALEPLASVLDDQLVEPVADLVRTMLGLE